MNEFPITPIRAKYADETTKGVNIDEALEGAAGDIDTVEGRVETLENTVGNAEGGLVKDVADLQTSVAEKTTLAAVQALIEGGTVSNAKPIYYHPIVLYGKSDGGHRGDAISLVALSNSNEAFTLSTFLQWIETNHITYLAPASGSIYYNGNRYIVAWIDIGYSDNTINQLLFRGHGVNTGDVYLEQIVVSVADVQSDYSLGDGVNKIN